MDKILLKAVRILSMQHKSNYQHCSKSKEKLLLTFKTESQFFQTNCRTERRMNCKLKPNAERRNFQILKMQMKHERRRRIELDF